MVQCEKQGATLASNDSDRELAAGVAALVERGVLDPGHPAYGVALAAIDLGYERLTRAQRGLYDRVVAPALAALAAGPAPPAGSAPCRAVALAECWRPIREAPDDRPVQLATMIDGEPCALAFACRQSRRIWVNAETRKPVFVRPSHWREWPDC
jgi:hypothetical protein